MFVDARRRRVYVSCGEGVIDVLAQTSSGYARIARIPTVAGARTSLFMPANDRLYLGVRATAAEPAAIWVFRPHAMTRSQRNAGLVLSPILAMAWSGDALAYRPFDGTDAAIAEPGQVEIELGPAQYLQIGSERTLVAPTVVLNYGLSERWELVLQGEAVHSLMQDSPKSSLVGNGLFLKAILREGSLQGQPGPSIATEFGFLLPSINDDPTNSTGGSVAGIVSQQWPWLTVHFNAALAITHQQTADAFVGLILEGPHDWPLRPVAEVFYERDFGGVTTRSALVGAIWQVRDNIAFDVGLRGAQVNDQPLREVRFGVTFGFPVR